MASLSSHRVQKHLLFASLMWTPASCVPLSVDRTHSQSLAKRATFFTGHCPGALPQDAQDYPRDISMQPWDVARDGTVTSIQYIDRWGLMEYIDDVEGLCDRAGCQCIGPVINCNIVESLLYEPAIALQYAEQCFHTCQCLAMPETTNIANATNPIDLGEGRVVTLPENLQNAVTRLNPDGAVQPKACLAGEATGWTFKALAGTTCCSGYSFNALSAQEAFMIYGFPYVSDIVAGIVTIGVCLPKSGSPKPG